MIRDSMNPILIRRAARRWPSWGQRVVRTVLRDAMDFLRQYGDLRASGGLLPPPGLSSRTPRLPRWLAPGSGRARRGDPA